SQYGLRLLQQLLMKGDEYELDLELFKLFKQKDHKKLICDIIRSYFSEEIALCKLKKAAEKTSASSESPTAQVFRGNSNWKVRLLGLIQEGYLNKARVFLAIQNFKLHSNSETTQAEWIIANLKTALKESKLTVADKKVIVPYRFSPTLIGLYKAFYNEFVKSGF